MRPRLYASLALALLGALLAIRFSPVKNAAHPVESARAEATSRSTLPGPTVAASVEKPSLTPLEWQRLLSQPPSAERDLALARALQPLNASDSPAATARFLQLSPAERIAVAAVVLAHAAQRSSDTAVHQAIRFCDEDPSYALEHGRSLISVLANAGDYTAALDFILAGDAQGWLGENGHKWLTTLFTTWGNAAPVQAAEAAQESVGPAFRSEALQTVAAAWARHDAQAAANFALRLPDADRARVLEIALNQWSDTDPAAAQAWRRRGLATQSLRN